MLSATAGAIMEMDPMNDTPLQKGQTNCSSRVGNKNTQYFVHSPTLGVMIFQTLASLISIPLVI